VVDEDPFDFRRPDLPAGDVECVVGSAMKKPKSVLIFLRPIAVIPFVVELAPVLLEIPVVTGPETLCHRGARIVRYQKSPP
jgi:hypothetical protein